MAGRLDLHDRETSSAIRDRGCDRPGGGLAHATLHPLGWGPMRFRTYPKIGSATAASSGASWVATEKVHGANFVIAIEGDAVWFGKRKGWLELDDAFFGWQLLAP